MTAAGWGALVGTWMSMNDIEKAMKENEKEEVDFASVDIPYVEKLLESAKLTQHFKKYDLEPFFDERDKLESECKARHGGTIPKDIAEAWEIVKKAANSSRIDTQGTITLMRFIFSR